jgi:hypothetical protein
MALACSEGCEAALQEPFVPSMPVLTELVSRHLGFPVMLDTGTAIGTPEKARAVLEGAGYTGIHVGF